MAVAAFVAWCGWLTVVDLRELRLPNWLTGAGALGVLGYGVVTDRWGTALSGGFALAAVYLLIYLAVPAAVGAGDVKLAFGVGGAAAFGGAPTWVWAAFLAPVMTAVVGLALLTRRGDPPDAPVLVPHGPSMCTATLLAMAVVG